MANPPVCRIMDYGKFKFDAAQRAKESRRKTSNVGIKEMKYRPKIGPGDFDTKTRQVLKFLSEGHKVKVTVMFRGREVIHPDLGKRILDKIAEQIDGVAKIETEGRLDGRNMVMVLAPDKRAKQSTEARHSTEQRHRATTNGNTPAGVPEELATTDGVELVPAVITEPAPVAAESVSGHEQVETAHVAKSRGRVTSGTSAPAGETEDSHRRSRLADGGTERTPNPRQN